MTRGHMPREISLLLEIPHVSLSWVIQLLDELIFLTQMETVIFMISQTAEKNLESHSAKNQYREK